MTGLGVAIQRASALDEAAIHALVRSERLNPFDLDWRRFVVARDESRVVGAVQVREHLDGSRELGSLVVHPAVRHRGIATRLVDAALASHALRVFMITGASFTRHYARWGFRPIEAHRAPWPVVANYWLGRLAGIQSRLAGRAPKPLAVLERRASSAPWRSQGPWPAV